MKGIRSLLFVPAETSKLKKIGLCNADAYIIDIEDSIAEEDKDVALERTKEFLSNQEVNDIFVRINKQRYKEDIKVLKSFNIGFMLPKIESETDYIDVVDILSEHKVIALIETPRALLNSSNIASLSWISALAFGAEDFTAATNMLNRKDNLAVAKNMLVFAAKAYGKKVYDTPCFQIKNEEMLHEELQQTLNLGFDGKLAIHPAQVEKINHAFMAKDPSYIRHLINVYESSRQAVCEIDGRVYEKLHIDRLKRILTEESEKKS